MTGGAEPNTAAMRRGLSAVAGVSAAALALYVADRIMQPVPIPAATALIGGLAAVWLARGAFWQRTAAGLTLGALVGALIHLWVHVTGRSTDPLNGIPTHVAVDGIRGWVVAAPAAILIAVLVRWIRQAGTGASR